MNHINFMYIKRKEVQNEQTDFSKQKEPKKMLSNHKHTLSEIMALRKINPDLNLFKIDRLNTIETNDKTPEKPNRSKKIISSSSSNVFNQIHNNNKESKFKFNIQEEDNSDSNLNEKSRKRSFLLKDFSSNDIFSGRIKKISKYIKTEKKNIIIEENENKQNNKEKEDLNINNNDQYYKFKQIYRNIESERLKYESNLPKEYYNISQEKNYNTITLSSQDKNLVKEAKKKYFEKRKKQIEEEEKKKEIIKFREGLIKDKEKRKIKQQVLHRHEKYNNTITKIKDNNVLTEGTKNLILIERIAAEESIQNGIYSSWINVNIKNEEIECFKIGSKHYCFCTHLFTDHKKINKISNDTKCNLCSCNEYIFFPKLPEETNLYKEAYKKLFNYNNWKGKCLCSHSNEEHEVNNKRKCKVKLCKCKKFRSEFLCGICGKKWEEHYMQFTTEDERIRLGMPIGSEFKPFTRKMYEELLKDDL